MQILGESSCCFYVFIKTLFKEWGGILGWAHAVKTFSNCFFLLCSLLIWWVTGKSNWWVIGRPELARSLCCWLRWLCFNNHLWAVWISWDWVGLLGLFDVLRGRDSESVWEKVVLSLSLSPMPYTEVPGVLILRKKWFRLLPDVIIRR